MAIKTSYVHRLINRKSIKKAKYNPRKMDKAEAQNLKHSLEEFGLCEPLVFNERTGTLVGGHQRLAILDKDHATKDYEIGVAVIDVDLATEKRLNIWLNQSAAQGSWDNKLLNDLRMDLCVPFNDFGFPEEESQYLEKLFSAHDEQISKILDIANTAKSAMKEEEQIQFNESPYVAPDILESMQRDKVQKADEHNVLDTARESITANHVEKYNKDKLMIIFSTVEKKIHFCDSVGIDFNLDTWEI
jgi:hypothetical protein